jgi:predicted nuclease of predicted toxin-antitoxin system
MKFLLDENISWRIARLFSENFAECVHVNHFFKTDSASDLEIWNFAKNNNWIIISIDNDFANLSQFYMTPPKVIHLKVHNLSNNDIAKKLIGAQSIISEFCKSEENLLLEIF